ncbi:MAG: AMP-binding protein, partial [bacterium]|nr:AMP-binding protein [bacterium]
TETTVTSIEMKIELLYENQSRVPVGKPIGNTKVYLLDKWKQVVPKGLAGELYIGGSGVARGYLNRPELTDEKFELNSTLYKTGDLARWAWDGDMEFLGRNDHQVKVRGFRIELGEIETRLEQYQGIKEAVVIAREDKEGENYLAAYYISASGGISSDQLRDYLSRHLIDHMIPSRFVKLDVMPLTSNGKPDRNALPEPGWSTGTGYRAPRDETETELVTIWTGLLGGNDNDTGQPGLSIGIDDNFFALGGHSLKAVMLGSQVHQRLNLKLSLTDIFKYPTIRGLAARLKQMKAAGEEGYISIEPVETKEYYPLSPAQERLFVLYRLNEDGIAYNMPLQLELKGEIDKTRLDNAFKRLVARHESFRTSFLSLDSQPVQIVHDQMEFEIECFGRGERTTKCSPLNGTNSGSHGGLPLQNFVRPFDLFHPPLLRTGLIQRDGKRHILMLDMHHIISDGASSEIISKDFMALYNGETLPPLYLQYTDYSQWQNHRMESDEIKKQEEYWLTQFDGELPVLDLPTDYERPSVRSFEGDRVHFELPAGTRRALLNFALEKGVTLYMVLLTVYSIFLSKITNQEDIVIGTVSAGRNHADLKKIVGMFVNTMGLRTFPLSPKRTGEYLEEVRQSTLAAFENQDYQYERLVEQVAENRDALHNPLFDTMLVLQNIEAIKIEVPGLKLTPYDYENRTSKFDLMLVANEGDETIRFTFEYSTTLFEKETIQRFIRYFTTLVSQMLAAPHAVLSELEIISGEEKQEILEDFNNTQSEYPSHRTIHYLFEEQAKRTPEQIALVEQIANKDHVSVSYKQLNHISDTVALHLIGKGVGPDTIAGIMVESSVEVVAGVLGILKAGGAYLPIDPDYPQERIDFMLKDSAAKILVTNGLKVKRFDGSGTPTSQPINHPTNKPTDLSYVIYTSGSTGKPRGVMVKHLNVVRLVSHTCYVQFKAGERVLQTGSLTFDASTFEIWGSLLNGMSLCMVGKERILDPESLKWAITNYRITTIWMTAPLFNQMLQEDIGIFAGLKNLLVGGDVLSPYHINQVRECFPGLNVINGYGPTENTTFSTTHLIRKQYKGPIPIGRPIANSTAYIVNSNRRLQPIGIPGELWVGGDGVSRGYLNKPELAHQKFEVRSWKFELWNTGD